ncbi:SDR family oxidoreductase [Alkalicoccobacillus porphyridii]|uniref:SDR family oxidoreductase n=1 Tax=Alkalicoccobacillus porphyridii TaxID=2597270 RepID=A0A553ZUC3_9BACI|nr:SDR family oxidoreductase [Alkalicoccobacillus porphyridii]TSB44896.1 SDR family oxidoreductase [Alkalicoccobacillus porphyridii]
MKIFVVGANGQIGKQVVEKIQNQGKHTAKAAVRKEEQLSYFHDLGAETALVDLEGSIEDIAEAAKGADAVVFAAGSGGKTGPDKTILIDMDGAIKTVEAAKQAGVKRFIIVSAIGVHNRNTWSDEIKHYSAAKHYADVWLEESGLDYTIIRPGLLTNDAGTGKVKAASDLERGEIPREDVANTIIESLDEDSSINKSFDLVSGDSTIKEALHSL